ncbi:hypothetical protein T261_8213 [Streptomyces lydicus]|nr:hypothetical protein T261_8213 [Streptomyces lydicus]
MGIVVPAELSMSRPLRGPPLFMIDDTTPFLEPSSSPVTTNTTAH